MPIFTKAPKFFWSSNSDGLAIRFTSERDYARAKKGRCDVPGQLGWIRMQMLVECGQAQVRQVDAGIFLTAEDAVRLDAETRAGFDLPPFWPGGIRLQTGSVPHSPNFTARLGLVEPGLRSTVRWDWKLLGPILELGQGKYLPTTAQYTALHSFAAWRDSELRDESSNLSMLASLRDAHDAGCHIDLEAYKATRIVKAKGIDINAREDGEGGLILRPLPEGYPDVTADDIEARFGHATGCGPRVVFRVRNHIVLLDEQQTCQARAIFKQRRISPQDRDLFSKNPQEWLREHHLLADQAKFSNRVTGIDIWREGYTGVDWETGIADLWERQPSQQVPSAERSADGEPQGTTSLDSEPVRVKVVPVILDNDQKLDYGVRSQEFDDASFQVNFSQFARQPKEHQKQAVIWMLKHARRALKRRSAGFGAGALLADDMGLGKTFSTLMFLQEWLQWLRKELGTDAPAVLIVAPLSLQENWIKEIKASYRQPDIVFNRVLMAGPERGTRNAESDILSNVERDFELVKSHPTSRDVAVPGMVREYGLVFGDTPAERNRMRLDMPGSCVLTTYQTLRDYRFSFAKAEWSTVVFDEAQNIKNPNAMQTIAAKALKAVFRIALTGTPVENHLGDFWSILDTAEPGPLGSFVDFREQWIQRIRRDPENMVAIGEELLGHVGELMLRRCKEDKDIGLELPGKSGHHESIPVLMTTEQVAAYDSVITGMKLEMPPRRDEVPRQNSHLAALWRIRQVSLHPDLLEGGAIPLASNANVACEILCRSAKLKWLLEQLNRIKVINEKALIFCVQKKLQEALAHHLSLIYGMNVPVVNGDTKAGVETDPKTRLWYIDQFTKREGFAVCILSPIAAGAGLNIVAANHVIHLERHWNPAKEDQATDRAYRMGQTLPVKVYLPAACHPNPERRSFDQVLHDLIQRKRGLQGALGLVPSPPVTEGELINEMFTPSNTETQQELPLDIDGALKISWKLFEALIAVLYKRSAKRVILTPGGSDHGCDVVVIGWGEDQENLLIQCKQTSSNKLDSEVAVREVEGARPFYENALSVSFGRRCLHTTARCFSRRTKRAAELCNVTIHDRYWLANELKQNPVTLAQVLAQNACRERL